MDNDQVKDGVVEKEQEGSGKTDDQPAGQSKETEKKEVKKPGKLSQLVRGLQKGYTLNRQEISEIKEILNEIKGGLRPASGEGGDDEYVTVAKLQQVLNQHAENQNKAVQQQREQADRYIKDTIAHFRAEGELKDKEEADEFIKYALKISEPNLSRAMVSWKEIRRARRENLKLSAKKEARKKEASKIGTSAKTGNTPGAIPYNQLKKGWDEI